VSDTCEEKHEQLMKSSRLHLVACSLFFLFLFFLFFFLLLVDSLWKSLAFSFVYKLSWRRFVQVHFISFVNVNQRSVSIVKGLTNIAGKVRMPVGKGLDTLWKRLKEPFYMFECLCGMVW